MSRNAWLTPDEIPGNTVCRVLRIPDDEKIIGCVDGALTLLVYAENWEEFGAVSADDMATAMWNMYRAYLEENCMTVGLITAYGGSSPPAGWLLCDGASYDCDDYPELYAVVGNAYGGTPDVTFNVPDARGRALVGADTLHSLGDEFGQSEVTLGISEIPSHNHSEQGVTTEVLPYWGGGPSAASIALPTVTGNTGGGGAHENTPPSIAINYIIKA